MGKELGDRIADRLKFAGIQQKELAEKIGITESAMSRYISGERDPKPNIIANMATALHTTSDYLLGIENEEFCHSKVKRMIARNASAMTHEEKMELVDALFKED
ncbi:MAG: helix-turn-helix domain-containing protein [Prevotella sp.]|nr:helix-turn-helix domain-containing protein [Prevotella sp.]